MKPVAPISVVIPLYNKRAGILRALASVFGQTRLPAEVIVVDDGSTDGGADTVDQTSDPRVRLVRQANAGVSAARNRGIELAASKVIAFLDADDEWMPDHLQTVCRLHDSFPACEVFATSYVFRTHEAAGDRRPVYNGLRPEPWEGVIDDYFAVAAASDPPLWSSAVAATRAALQSVGGFPVGIAQGEDLLTWTKLALRYPIALSRRATAVFWQPEFGSGVPTRAPQVPDRAGAEFHAMLAGADPSIRDSLRRYVALWHKMRGSMFLSLGMRRDARAEFRQAMRLAGCNTPLLAKLLMTALPVGATRRALRAWATARRPKLAAPPAGAAVGARS